MKRRGWTPIPGMSSRLPVAPVATKSNHRLPPPAPQTFEQMLVDDGRGFVHRVDEENQFAHPPHRAPLAAEVVEKRLSLEDDVNVVKKKIREAVASDDGTPEKLLQKMGNDVKFLQKVLEAQHFGDLE